MLAFSRGFDVRHTELDGELLGGLIGELGFRTNEVRRLQKYDHNFFIASFHWTFRCPRFKVTMRCTVKIINYRHCYLPFNCSSSVNSE